MALPFALAAACATPPDIDRSGEAASAPPDQVAVTARADRSREKAITSYRDYLRRYPDSPERDRVSRRLADLLLERAADLQASPTTIPGETAERQREAQQAYAEAIDYYEALLAKDPEEPQNTALLYQLARAYEESGRSQQALATIDHLLAQETDADMRLYADTRFRQAELLFAQGRYPEAGEAYRSVVELGESVPAYEQSLYKLGWSLFKQDRYREALPVLFSCLEQHIDPGQDYQAQRLALSPADREQTDDLLRVSSRSFAQLGGVDAVAIYFRENGGRSYEREVYLELADWYVEQERVNAAATTWLALAQTNPLDSGAPRLMEKAIDLYRKAGFQQRVLEVEALFVQTYGIGSEFWTAHSPAEFPEVQESLQSSLQELARHSSAHSSAPADSTVDNAQLRDAEHWYRLYLAAYATEAAAAQMNFELAELLYADSRYREALQEYEKTAWSYGPHENASEAALGVQRAAGKILPEAGAAERQALTELAGASALRFINTYPDHPAAPGLLAQTGTASLEQQDYGRAIDYSEQVLETRSTSTELNQVAWSLKAQALFARQEYAGAASAYRQALQLTDSADARRPALLAGLASALYQQGEQALLLGDKTLAANLYQQAAALAPEGEIGSRALYDAASTLIALESWQDAIDTLQRFREDYPQDPLQGEVTRKLAYVYESSEDYPGAAREYLRLGQDSQQPALVQREALLRAAELYRQTGVVSQAIIACEDYLQRFPQPGTEAVAVMQQLVDLERDAGDVPRSRHWLQAIIALDRNDGSAATHAAAARASLELAEQQLAAFRRIKLVAPVQEHVAQKIEAMKQALRAYEKALDYGVYPVMTAATHQIASMYDELGRDLLASERPAGLTAGEGAEYERLLAQQAASFEQKAIEIYRSNAQRSGSAQRDAWVQKSERQLYELQHAR